jgi:hypothetical protein
MGAIIFIKVMGVEQKRIAPCMRRICMHKKEAGRRARDDRQGHSHEDHLVCFFSIPSRLCLLASACPFLFISLQSNDSPRTGGLCPQGCAHLPRYSNLNGA